MSRIHKNPPENILERFQDQLVELDDITERLCELNREEELHLIAYPDDEDISQAKSHEL